MNRREFLGGSAALGARAALAGDEKTTDGGFADVSWPDRPGRDVPVLPAGAGSADRFASRCIGCHLCVAACPSKCLRPSTAWRRLGRVELDFRHGWCRPTCTRCGEVCPVNALAPLTVVQKRDVHVGFAQWRRDLCVRTTKGDPCRACEKHCPVRAVSIVGGFPVVDRDACIGCGACEHYCPARPGTAIRVVGYEQAREVHPMDDSDLVAEMRTQLAAGKTLVVARGGVITFMSEAHMVGPLEAALAADPNALRGATVLDKVVGKAAAKRHIAAGVRRVITPVLAEPAKAMLEKAGIEVVADLVVPKILNRDRTGECPLDAAIAD